MAATNSRRPLTHRSSSAIVPILLYHYIGGCSQADQADLYRADLWVTTENFEQHLQYLQQAGYTVISLNPLLAHLEGDDNLPARPVVLTFDDGQADNYTAAFPLLRKYNTTATFFAISDLIGTPGYMSWNQLREMAAAGMAIESHTATHRSLPALSSAELRRQLESSRDTIEEQLGRAVRFLAYPGGHYNAAVLAATRAAGYDAALTAVHDLAIGRNALFELPRVRVRSTDTAPLLAERMGCGKTWRYALERNMRRWGLWKTWKKTRRKVRKALRIRGRSFTG